MKFPVKRLDIFLKQFPDYYLNQKLKKVPDELKKEFPKFQKEFQNELLEQFSVK